MKEVLIRVTSRAYGEVWERRFGKEEVPIEDVQELRSFIVQLSLEKQRSGVQGFAYSVASGFFSIEENKTATFDFFRSTVSEPHWKIALQAGVDKMLDLTVTVEIDGVIALGITEKPNQEEIDQWIEEGFKEYEKECEQKKPNLSIVK